MMFPLCYTHSGSLSRAVAAGAGWAGGAEQGAGSNDWFNPQEAVAKGQVADWLLPEQQGLSPDGGWATSAPAGAAACRYLPMLLPCCVVACCAHMHSQPSACASYVAVSHNILHSGILQLQSLCVQNPLGCL